MSPVVTSETKTRSSPNVYTWEGLSGDEEEVEATEQSHVFQNLLGYINEVIKDLIDSEGAEDSSSHTLRTMYWVTLKPSSSSELKNTASDNSESATAEAEKPDALTKELQQIFFAAREEVFEDGMDSVFSGRLVNFMRRHNRLAIDILSDLLILEQVNAEVAGEALRHVGYLEHTPTHISRRRLLEHCLFGSSARIRDGAILGIAAMDDPRATPSVKRAINRETIPELKRDMNAVLEQLCETKNKV